METKGWMDQVLNVLNGLLKPPAVVPPPVEPPVDPQEPTEPTDPIVPPADPTDPVVPVTPGENVFIKKNYDFTLTMEKASGLLGSSYKGSIAVGDLSISGWSADFATPEGKTFLASGTVTKIVDSSGKEILEEYLPKLNFKNEELVYTGATMQIEER
jgi:hypothetical protein